MRKNYSLRLESKNEQRLVKFAKRNALFGLSMFFLMLSVTEVQAQDKITLSHRYVFNDNVNDEMGTIDGKVKDVSETIEALTYEEVIPAGAIVGAPAKSVNLGVTDNMTSTFELKKNVINSYSGSVSLWLNLRELNGQDYVFGPGTGFFIKGAGIAGAMNVNVKDQVSITTDVLTLNDWHHFVMAWDTTDLLFSLYVDGSIVGSPVSLTGPVLQPHDVRVGNFSTTGSNPANNLRGNMYDLQFYDGAVSAIQAKALFDAPGSITIEGVTLKTKTLTLPIGTDSTLAAIAPAGTALTWGSLDETVATVDNAGKVTGVSVGSTKVWVSMPDYSDTCEVTVRSTPVLLSTEIALEAGYDSTLVTIAPSGTTLTWGSLDETVATVDAAGKVTAVSAGITGVWASIDAANIDTCEVTVFAIPTNRAYIAHRYTFYNNLRDEVGILDGIRPHDTITTTDIPSFVQDKPDGAVEGAPGYSSVYNASDKLKAFQLDSNVINRSVGAYCVWMKAASMKNPTYIIYVPSWNVGGPIIKGETETSIAVLVSSHDGGSKINADITIDQWHHVAVTWNNRVTHEVGSFSVYLDGELVDAGTYPQGRINNPFQPMTVGNFSIQNDVDRTPQQYDGKLYDLQFYDGPLSADSVKYLYDNPGAIIEDPVSIDAKSTLESISVYPNPTKGTVTITGVKSHAFTLEIYNITGQKVFEKSVFNNQQVDTNLDAGIYFMNIDHKNIKKLIVK